ncbi:MAG: DNA primase [Acutalibacteraceae bacterium]|nr:DNA primase [Acutalibacteraceae bacterium]
MRLSEDFLSELRMRCDIESLISSYVTLKRRGNTFVGLCPFHNEKTGSFTVYPQTSSFYCFGCGAGGDAITFISKIENLSYIDAVKNLADRAGLAMPEEGYDDSMQKLRIKVLEANREAAKFFNSTLNSDEGKKGLQYLLERKLEKKTITKFGLGFAPDKWTGLYDRLKSKGFSDTVMLQANLIVKKKNGNGYYDRFKNRVMFPIIDLRGNVIAFGGRKLPDDDSSAKYINTSDTPVYKKSNNVFALNFAKNSKREGLVLCEGYMDVISMHQAGVDNAVAACGTSFTHQQARLLSRYSDKITVMLDADAAGEKATDKAIEILNPVVNIVSVLRLPDAKDPDEYIKKFGPEKFNALLDGASNDIEYKLFSIKNKFDISTENGKWQYLKECAKILASVNDAIARQVYAGKIAGECNIATDVLLREIDTLVKKNYYTQKKRFEQKTISNDGHKTKLDLIQMKNLRADSAEKMLISILIKSPKVYDKIQDRINGESFVTEINKRVFLKTVEIINDGRVPELAYYSGEFSAEEMGHIVEIFNITTNCSNINKEVNDCIEVINEEKNKLMASNPSDMEKDEWAETMKKLAQKKRGNKNV